MGIRFPSGSPRLPKNANFRVIHSSPYGAPGPNNRMEGLILETFPVETVGVFYELSITHKCGS